MIEAYKKFWKGYVDFEGRSTRSDYWFAYLANMLTVVAFMCCSQYLEALQVRLIQAFWLLFHLSSYLSFLPLVLLRVLPGIAVTVRRLRDAGYNWPYIFISLIPFVGPIIFIVLLCKTN